MNTENSAVPMSGKIFRGPEHDRVVVPLELQAAYAKIAELEKALNDVLNSSYEGCQSRCLSCGGSNEIASIALGRKAEAGGEK